MSKSNPNPVVYDIGMRDGGATPIAASASATTGTIGEVITAAEVYGEPTPFLFPP